MERVVIDEQYKKSEYSEFFLVLDIGASKTRAGIAGKKKGTIKLVFVDYYNTKDILSIENLRDIVNNTLRDAKMYYDIEVKRCCIAAAGLVRDNRCKLTNASLEIDGDYIRNNSLLQEVIVINDVEAVARAINFIPESEIMKINDAKVNYASPSVVIKPGTGLGVGIIKQGVALASEAGHISFTAKNDFEWVLTKFIKENKTKRFPEFEDALSAEGMYSIYQYLQLIKFSEQAFETRYRIARHSSKSLAIIQNKNCPLCKKTIEMYVDILAEFSQMMALIIEPRRGIYLSGGIVNELKQEIKERFINEFYKNSSMLALLKEIPVFIMLTEEPGLIGAASIFQ